VARAPAPAQPSAAATNTAPWAPATLARAGRPAARVARPPTVVRAPVRSCVTGTSAAVAPSPRPARSRPGSGTADCCDPLVCTGGLCRPPAATAVDGSPCLSGVDCAGGGCVVAPGVDAGVCCSSADKSCAVSSGASGCCAPLTCNDAARTATQVCATCLDWTNSGAADAGIAQCVETSQCCAGQSLTCERSSGKCCKNITYPCTDSAECCSGSACGTRKPSVATACCAAFGSRCGGDGCCDGLKCGRAQASPTGFSCYRAPGGPCGSSLDCAPDDACHDGTCCTHSGTCTSGAECCSGVCTQGFCQAAPPYGQCVRDNDCAGFSGTPICGANPVLDAGVCCPVAGDVCTRGQATCCASTDLCQVPLTRDAGAPPVCCRDFQAACTSDAQCCTGTCGGSGCCSAAKRACNVGADCCGGLGTSPTQLCVLGACCFNAGQSPFGDATLCCSGRLDNSGRCRP
jgi:hypothetical protein